MDYRKVKKIYQKGKRKDSIRYVMICLECGNEFEIMKRDYNRGRGIYCGMECNLENKSGKRNGMWKGGKKIARGYILIHKASISKKYHYLANNSKFYIPEHRLMADKKYKRKLTSKDIVHHLNGIRDDNRFENLVIVNKNNHEKHTLEKQLKIRIIKLEKKLDKLKNV